MTETFWYIAFPYTALAIAIIGGIRRYFKDRFSFSSLSSQFLENRQLFWGSVPWHYGIIPILLAHLLALIVPGAWGGLLGNPLRLSCLEVLGLALAMLSLVGLFVLIVRRLCNARVRKVTSPLDWILLCLLCLQVVLGVVIAIAHRWGSLWYLHTAVPWLVSLLDLHPEAATIANLPMVARMHMVNAFALILLFPFTRLVHIFTFPVRYLSRPWQVVFWNQGKTARNAKANAGGDR